MSERGVAKRKFVLQRTARALLCLFGFVWLLFLEVSPGDGCPIGTKSNGSDFVLAAFAERAGTDEFGATLEDSVELAAVDLHELSSENYPTAPALTGASESAPHTRPDLSPPLVV